VLSDWIELNKANWGEALTEKNFGLKYAVNFLVCFAIYMGMTHMLINHRFYPGAMVDDPIFKHITPHNFSVPVFFCTYTGIFAFLYFIIPQPRLFMFAVRAFVLLFAFRLFFIMVMPLLPAPDMIDLRDPFTDNVIGFKGQVRNDLFFSGHVADLSFFAICCFNKTIRRLLILITICAAVMLVWQKVHYTADVVAAPIFSFVVYVLIVQKHAYLYVPHVAYHNNLDTGNHPVTS
jgi:PAP2 superfamily C-terminal